MTKRKCNETSFKDDSGPWEKLEHNLLKKMKSNLNFQTVLFQFTTSEVLLGKVSEDQENLSPNFFLFWYSLESLISGLFLVRSPGKLFSMKIFFLSCG